MKAEPRFLRQPREFWAHVRTISQEIGYTDRGKRAIKVPSIESIKLAFDGLGLSVSHLQQEDGTLTDFGKNLLDYFGYRASILNHTVQGLLMDKRQAEIEFKKLKKALKPRCPLPMNKQKGTKKNHAFLSCMINMLIEKNIGAVGCDYDPRSLTTVTHERMPLRTLARRVDGAFPSVVNPIAIWEIKEYYYTTTFGSRVADGVYETLLDGMEIEELEIAGHKRIQHILFVDDRFTWWDCGRSYLCRLIDMLHMGYVDEVVFGREVLTRVPSLAMEWLTMLSARDKERI